MNPNVCDLVSQYRHKGILIDTNLLLVLLVGNVDRRLIGRTARTDGYSSEDYERLRELLGNFARFIILPQILTEAGTFLKRNCPSENTRLDLYREFALFVHAGSTREARITSKRIVRTPLFSRVGYTDASMLAASAGKYLLVTADGRLHEAAWNSGVDILPFHWLQGIH